MDLEERKLQVEVKEPGNAYLLPLLEQYRAEWAIIRQWAGTDQQLAALTDEIDRLTGLLSRTIWDLRRPDVDPERVSRSLERALRGG